MTEKYHCTFSISFISLMLYFAFSERRVVVERKVSNCSAISWREPIVLLCYDDNQLFCYVMMRTNCSAMSWWEPMCSAISWREPIVLLYHDENQCVLLYHDENQCVLLCHDENQLFCYIMTRTNCSAISWREPIVLLYHDQNQLHFDEMMMVMMMFTLY